MRRETVLLFVSFATLVGMVTGRSKVREVNDIVDDDDGFAVPFSLEESYAGTYTATSFNGTWISSDEILYRESSTYNLLIFNVESLESTFFLNASVLTDYNASSYSLSPDGAYILIGYSSVTGFRHSSFSKYVVYNIANETYDEIADGEHLPLATWASIGNGLAYVLNNDVYYREMSDNGITVRRLTTDGVIDVIYNGVPDWVYEEEVFGTGSGIWFSPDGKHLVIASFNDTEVNETIYQYYGEPGDLEYQYPTEVSIRYPKAGTKNPTVSLSLIDLTNSTSSLIDLAAPTDVIGLDHIIFTVSWLNNDSVVATWTNRVQNLAQLTSYDTSGYGTNILKLEETEGWLEVPTPIYHNGYFVLLQSQDSGTSAGNFKHVTRYNIANNVLSNETDLSTGLLSVTSLIGIDSVNNRIYYLATGDNEPSQRHLYSVPLEGSYGATCISCNQVTPEGNTCLYAAGSFSRDKSYYVLTCSGPDPTTVRIFNSSHEQIFSWQENESLREKLTARLQPTLKNLYVTANGYNSNVRLVLPPQLDETDTETSYPMIVYVYAGPNTVRITDAASYGFQSYMATNRSVIYAYIDGRGCSYRGSKMLFEIYRSLGTVEIEDQIAVTKILQDTYSWIDADRTAIWGWSYGGYSTAMVLATDTHSVFKCGISVAPVTSWIYYDTIYTERYMALPTEDDNLAAYNASDVTRLVEGLRNKKFMLIHGSADDNVHFQQSLALAKALQTADILFEQVTYTDEAHGLTGMYPHLYHTMDRFWGECLSLDYIY